MPDIDAYNDTTDDHERFEAELLARDRGAVYTTTADIDDKAARHLIDELVDNGVVVPFPGERLLVHEPSRKAFDSITQLAVFHRGWTVGRDADQKVE